MLSAWFAYIPQPLLQPMLGHAATDLPGQERRFSAVALFADVSGFTAMSEALGVAGRHGTEELTTILNSYFGPMIDLIHSFGGIIGKFGGDAMTVLFPYTRRSRAAATRRAVQCALAMQADMHRYAAIATSVGTFSLAMKAGLARGSVLCAVVGEPALRLEYVIAGNVLDVCADAEHHASRGEVIVHHALLADLPGAVWSETRGDFCRVERLQRRAPALLQQPSVPPAASAPIVEQLAHFLHPAIAQRLRAGQLGMINEHRKVTTLFVRFSGFDYDNDAQVVAKLQRYLSAVIRSVQRYDGYLNKVDMGDKGSKYIVLFGAPVAHEDDEERALRCALDLHALSGQFPELGVAISVGVHTGLVYCGQVGGATRQEYTVMGDPVNLAARLMQAAQTQQVLASSFTQRYVAEAFVWEALAPLNVKGKTEPVAVYAVRGVSVPPALVLREPAYALPMVGRAAELQRIQTAIDLVLHGRGQVVGIAAEAGLGKSRLSAEVIRLAIGQGFTGYAGACQSYGTSSSYLVWRDIWRGFFGIDSAAPEHIQLQHLETQLAAIDPRLVQRTPLLGVLLNLAIPDNELTVSLDGQMRVELLTSLLSTCLRHRDRITLVRVQPRAPRNAHVGAPLLLVLEDCHWIDPLSADLLEFIGRNLGDLAILMLVLYRPAPDERGPLAWGAHRAHVHEIELTELAPADARQLINLKLQQRLELAGPPPDGLAEQLVARAEGNPFYLEELVNYLHDQAIDLDDEQALAALALPDSLHSLIISRIDKLAEDEKTTLKVASVIGRLFKAHWLWGSYPQIGAPESVKHQLTLLSRLDLTPLDKPEPHLEYLFKHITTQHVAYESLAFATRATLHDYIGQFVERTYADSLAQFVDVLAYHYGRSGNRAKQQRYFRQAGDAAKATYANQAAIDYYQRLLTILEPEAQGEILLELGEISQLIGRWDAAEKLYRQALDLAQQQLDQRLQARCCTALGSLLSHTQSYEVGLEWLAQAQTLFEQLGEPAGVSRALEYASFAYIQQGNYGAALASSQDQLQIATARADFAGMSAALAYMGLAYWRQSDLARALPFLEQAVEVAVKIGHRRGEVLARSDVAGVYWQMGDYARSLTSLRQALATAHEIGYLQAIGFTTGNAGEIYRQQGDDAQALACYRAALQIAVELNDTPNIQLFLSNIATTFAAQQRVPEAERLYTRAIELGRALNIPYGVCEDVYRLAALRDVQQDYREASILNQEALDIATQIERKDIVFLCSTLAIRLRVALNETDAASAVGELTALLAVWSDASEQAALHSAIWQLDPAREDAQHAAADAYRSLYAHTPNIEYRSRYAALTGALLPASAPLSPLPDELLGSPVDLAVLLERALARNS